MNGDGGRNFFNRKNFKLGLKHWIGTAIVGIVAAFVIWGMLNGQEFLASFLLNREAKRIQQEFERPYREDKYGGKTPEETFDLFLEALRKDDIDLASKYFVLDKQEQWRKTLENLKKNNAYDEMLVEMEYARGNSRKITENNGVKFVYEITIEKEQIVEFLGENITLPPGKYGAEIVLEDIFGKWKLVRI